MNFIYTFIIFLALLILSEIVAIILKITGLDMEKARFQVISIITHTGFTTRESELISQHPLRRKIISYLMLISYVFQATFFSVVVSSIKDNGIFNVVILVVGILLLLVFILKNGRLLLKIEPFLDKYISKRWMKGINSKSIEKVLYISAEYELLEIVIKENSILSNILLKDIPVKNINILLIDKGNKLIPTPKGNDTIEIGDRIIIYGKTDKLKELQLSKK